MEKQLKKLTIPIQKLVSAHARWAFFHKTEPDSAKRLCEELDAFFEEVTKVRELVKQNRS